MYARLRSSFRERCLHRASSNVKLQLDRSNRAARNEGVEEKPRETEAETVSTRFPDYKVIYTFPRIKYVSALNATKLRFTYFTGAIVPVIVGLRLFDVVSFEVAVTSITCGIILTAWLHTLAIPCNNLVGYIYLKSNEKRVILSYVDYRGKRVDMETTLDEIVPLSDNPISITDSIYKKILFASQKRRLKIILKMGCILDPENLKYTLGTV